MSSTETHTAPRTVTLDVTGMTCASCVARVEKKLRRVGDVDAVVNLALERASVQVSDPSITDAQLVEAVEKGGYGAHVREAAAESTSIHGPDTSAEERAARDKRDTLIRTVLAAILSAPIFLISMIPALQFPGWQWAMLILATPVVFYCGAPFHRATWVNIKHGGFTMDTLVTMGTFAAYLWSIWALLFGGAGEIGMTMDMSLGAAFSRNHHGAHEIYFESAAVITTLVLVGRYAQARAIHQSSAAIRSLLDLGAKNATIMELQSDGSTAEVEVPIGAVRVGDVFVVRPGEKVATDGVILEGSSAIDRSMLTGESIPEDVTPGTEVTGATVNTTGRLLVRATRVGADTELAHIAKMVEDAQASKAPVQQLVDKVASIFVPIVIVLAILTLVAWIALGGTTEQAFTAAVAVLIIACPCALGLATPTAIMVGTGRGAELGILIRSASTLESSRDIATIVLDKTGTLTSGAMRVHSVTPAEGWSEANIRALAGTAESGSEHPIARAIVEAAGGSSDALTLEDARAHVGRGLTARVSGSLGGITGPWEVEITAASDAGQASAGTENPTVPSLPAPLAASLREAEQAGHTTSIVRVNGEIAGLVRVSDTVKPEATKVVEEIRALGIEPVMATGDNPAAAEHIAREVGIEKVHASLTPAAKLDLVKSLRGEGASVAMVGDGINDTAALAEADLGFAMGTGTDAAMNSGDIVLTGGDIAQIPTAIRLSRASVRTIRWNLFWAFIYNVIAIPLAMLGLLGPVIAAAAMAFSSVFVVSNSLRLKRFQ
ncbi:MULTISPECIES: heavy metal translocating P-type ATPase [Dermabacter]|uniref:Carbonate dehydratase n=2 Tax=Dermabacter TaxID=36739 RepID=A0ABR4SM94_9MICO|nr:heavy metal translocating P-type ATPase [Dermabacter jinjuensis]ATH97257.1 heavy metal translocating P-type ATPase [Dermabacter jinjuensis]KDS94244.1 carbonate dehydratase [Dermabacter hominis 1368]UEB89431.1 heavy metal translocating P-type ATPase [Dermabacter jinjuensis]